MAEICWVLWLFSDMSNAWEPLPKARRYGDEPYIYIHMNHQVERTYINAVHT